MNSAIARSHRAWLIRTLAFTLTLFIARVHAAPVPLEIPFQLIGNHVVVPVQLGNRDLSFILDTGAGNTLIDLGVARDTNLPLGQPLKIAGAGPGTTAGAMLAGPAGISIGGRDSAVQVRLAAAVDFTELSTHAGRDVDGILGGDFIRRFVVEIDFEHTRLRLHDPAGFSPPASGTTLPLTFSSNGFPTIESTLKISDQQRLTLKTVLDVGSALQVIVTNPIVESRGLAEKLSASQPIPVGRGAGGSSDGRVARVPAVMIGDITVSKPVVILSGPNSGVLASSQVFEANIGTGVMRRFTVFFDYGHSRVTFQPNGLIAEPFEHDMSGLVFTTEGRPYAKRIIEMVMPGLPGDAAGLKVGDRLKSIDDAAAGTLSMDAIRDLFRQDGRSYRIVVERDGKDLTFTLKTKRLV